MAIEIVELTDKGRILARSIRSPDTLPWRLIHFLDRVGGRSTKDKITDYVFGGDVVSAAVTLRSLKAKRIIAQESEGI